MGMKTRPLKIIGICTTILLQGFVLKAQIELPQNIYRVTVNSRYVIEKNQRTSTFFAIRQQISDSLGRLHREIDYDWETHAPNTYRWHYFNGLQKVKTDFFAQAQLRHIEEYAFDAEQNLVSITLHTVTPGDTVLTVKEVYTLNPNGQAIKASGYDAKGKRRYKTSYKYDAQGNEIYRKVKGKRLLPPDSITFMQREIEYDSLNRIVSDRVSKTVAGKPQPTKTCLYSYNDKGLVAQKVIMDSAGAVLQKEVYAYQSSQRIQRKEVFDAQGNLIDYQAWRYEIYKTPDRRHRTLE